MALVMPSHNTLLEHSPKSSFCEVESDRKMATSAHVCGIAFLSTHLPLAPLLPGFEVEAADAFLIHAHCWSPETSGEDETASARHKRR